MHNIEPAIPLEAPGPEAFAFVEELAHELSAGTVELPSFPSVVARIHDALADDTVTTETMARIVAAEPAIATRVLIMANSAEMINGGRRVNDLAAAIGRLGMNTVRTASIAFALEQIKKAEEFKSIGADLQYLWQRSVLIAALCHVTARRFSPVNMGAAMLAGLLHAVGRLYILSRANRHPRLFSSPTAFQEILNDWHASIAKALLESWNMPDDIVRAVHEFESHETESRGSIQINDVLTIAGLLARYQNEPDTLEIDPDCVNAARRLDAGREDCMDLLAESKEEMKSLLKMLGSK